ncbi:unnamed protein product [Brassica oleracea]
MIISRMNYLEHKSWIIFGLIHLVLESIGSFFNSYMYSRNILSMHP